MKTSRFTVGVSVLLATATPLFLLSRVTYGVRYGILTRMYEDADVAFPELARLLWIFGPLDGWSYLTPFALAVGAAARIRRPLSHSILTAMLVSSLLQSIVMFGSFQPFSALGDVIGHPPPTPYPVAALAANLAMLLGASWFAWVSIRRGFHDGTPDTAGVRADKE